MIRYALACDNHHEFEGWFAESADFDRQKARGLLSCPVCGSEDISKLLMAPAVSTSRKKDATHALAVDEVQKATFVKLKEAVAAIRANSEDVGERFPEEARKIHYGEADSRGIVGQATPAEAKALIDEGIAVAPLPILPDDVN